MASERGLQKVLELFFDEGGDITEKNNAGFTCLHIAAREGHTDLVKWLLYKGKSLIFLKFIIFRC